MRILWITNVLLPEASDKMGFSKTVFGGWLHGLSKDVANNSEIALAVATAYDGDTVRSVDAGNILYYAIPFNGNNREYPSALEKYWRQIVDEFRPNIVHIHGTEYLRALACMRACPKLKYIISIQGLNSGYYPYHMGGLSKNEIRSYFSIVELLRRNSPLDLLKDRIFKATYEKEYFSKALAVIGRTSWDYAHAKYSGTSKYIFCNESLRTEFYVAEKWNSDSAGKHTIFLSQGGVPLKGMHQVLKAVSLIIDKYPGIEIRVAGNNILRGSSFKDKMLRSTYGNYIYYLINHFGLQNNVVFLGDLDTTKIICEYQKARVFICPSSIENSPNSLGEAQLLGTPVIASYAGGVPDMVNNNETGLLYRFEEIVMLAENICRIFENDLFAKKLSVAEIEIAEKRHDRKCNLENLISIYRDVYNKQ